MRSFIAHGWETETSTRPVVLSKAKDLLLFFSCAPTQIDRPALRNNRPYCDLPHTSFSAAG